MDRRFHTGFRADDTDFPGLVQEDDGTCWVIEPDGTRTQLPGTGTGCPYLTCEDDAAVLLTQQVILSGRKEVQPDNVTAYLATEDENGSTRAQVSLSLSDTEDSSARIGTTNTGALVGSQLAFDFDAASNALSASLLVEHPTVETSAGFRFAADSADLFSTMQLFADRVHFAGGVPIDRPTFDLSSGTLAQLAQALADLGLIAVVP